MIEKIWLLFYQSTLVIPQKWTDRRTDREGASFGQVTLFTDLMKLCGRPPLSAPIDIEFPTSLLLDYSQFCVRRARFTALVPVFLSLSRSSENCNPSFRLPS